jgi:hypothetical protein
MDWNESLSHLDLFTPIRIHWIQRRVGSKPVWTITNKEKVIHFVGNPEKYQVIYIEQYIHLIVIYFYVFVFYFKNMQVGFQYKFNGSTRKRKSCPRNCGNNLYFSCCLMCIGSSSCPTFLILHKLPDF